MCVSHMIVYIYYTNILQSKIRGEKEKKLNAGTILVRRDNQCRVFSISVMSNWKNLTKRKKIQVIKPQL